MIERGDYIIQISKLRQGENLYEIHADKDLFEEFDCKEAEDLDCNVSLRIVKNERLIEIFFSFKGTMDLICGRCLSPLKREIDKQTVLYIKYGEQYCEPDVNERLIPEGENEIDILSYVYEELRIEIPISPVHEREEDCDKEMIMKLKANNAESRKNSEDFDQRWAKLKDLKQ